MGFTCGSIAAQATSDPAGVAAAVENRNHAHEIAINFVMDGKRESFCQAAVRPVNDAMDASVEGE